MRRGFLNGLITGGFLVAIYGLFARPEMKPDTNKFMGQSKKIQKKAKRVFNDVSETVNDFIKR